MQRCTKTNKKAFANGLPLVPAQQLPFGQDVTLQGLQQVRRMRPGRQIRGVKVELDGRLRIRKRFPARIRKRITVQRT